MWAPALGLAAFLRATGANAGNLDAFYLSGAAALQAGAITATSEGGGAIWYNPAGLASLSGGRVDVSVNGYALKFGGNPELTSDENATVQNMSRLDLNVVPTALTLVQRWRQFGIGLGVFVPSQRTGIVRTLVKDSDANGSLEFLTDIYQRYQSYHAGPSLGFSPNEKLDFGASLFFNYQTSLSTEIANVNGTVSGGSYAVTSHLLDDSIRMGLELVLGVKWHPTPNWRFGATVRTPAVRIAQVLQQIETTTSAGSGSDPVTSTTFTDDFGFSAAVTTPFRFHLGLARYYGPYTFSADTSILLPFIDERFNVNGRATWNARLGVRREMNEDVAIGGGIFTDLSTSDTPVEFGDSQVNFYGLTAAADFRTRYMIAGKSGQSFEKPALMVFGTTVALSYAIGVGTVMGAVAAFDSTNGVRLAEVPADVVVHEITLHLGSSFSE